MPAPGSAARTCTPIAATTHSTAPRRARARGLRACAGGGARRDACSGRRQGGGEPQISCGLCVECVGGLPNLCKTTRRPGHGWGGTFAERIVAPESVVYRLDDARSYEEGALVEPAAVAYRAVSRSNIRIADRVAVLGAGPLSALSSRSSSSRPLRSFSSSPTLRITTSSSCGRSKSSTRSTSAIARPTTSSLTSRAEAASIPSATSSSSRGLLDAVRLVRPGGTIVQVAIYGDPIPLDATGAVLREARIVPSLTDTPAIFVARSR